MGNCGTLLEALHRLGLSISYETVVSALRRNGEASLKQLPEETRHRRFFVSFDNMNFIRNVRDQRTHNHSHQVNYTAGFAGVMPLAPRIEISGAGFAHLAGEMLATITATAASFQLEFPAPMVQVAPDNSPPASEGAALAVNDLELAILAPLPRRMVRIR